jgi:hypothetical protein
MILINISVQPQPQQRRQQPKVHARKTLARSPQQQQVSKPKPFRPLLRLLLRSSSGACSGFMMVFHPHPNLSS